MPDDRRCKITVTVQQIDATGGLIGETLTREHVMPIPALYQMQPGKRMIAMRAAELGNAVAAPFYDALAAEGEA